MALAHVGWPAEGRSAIKTGIFGVSDNTGPVTLLGLVETMEAGNARSYFSPMSNASDGVNTWFSPE